MRIPAPGVEDRGVLLVVVLAVVVWVGLSAIVVGLCAAASNGDLVQAASLRAAAAERHAAAALAA